MSHTNVNAISERAYTCSQCVERAATIERLTREVNSYAGNSVVIAKTLYADTIRQAEQVAIKSAREAYLEGEIRGLKGMVNDLLAYIDRMAQMAAHDEEYSSTIREIAADAMKHGRKAIEKK